MGESKGKGKGKFKGKGKCKGTGGLHVRDEAANAVIAVMQAMSQRKESGMLVNDFLSEAPSEADRKHFDELTQLCLARFLVGQGSWCVCDNGEFRNSNEYPKVDPL